MITNRFDIMRFVFQVRPSKSEIYNHHLLGNMRFIQQYGDNAWRIVKKDCQTYFRIIHNLLQYI